MRDEEGEVGDDDKEEGRDEGRDEGARHSPNQVKIKDQECLLESKPDQVQLKTEVGVLCLIGTRLVLADLEDA